MELKNTMKTSELQETDLEEIDGGAFFEDINNVPLFKPAAMEMENNSWMEEIPNHGSLD